MAPSATPAIRPKPSKNPMYMEVRKVTRELAIEWLGKNGPNRPVRQPHVRELSRDMSEGRWKLTHQGVAFNVSGKLIDGQHRLEAIVDSGVPAEMPVFFNVPDDAWDAIDQHLKRTGAQVLAMHGVSTDAPRLIAMARTILTVIHEQNKVGNTAAAEFVLEHQAEMVPFLSVAKQFTPAVAAAFAWCTVLGWQEALPASKRLLSAIWESPAAEDPMRALHQRAKEFSRLGAGQAGIKNRFDLALTCLKAVHEKRGMKTVRSVRVDYSEFQAPSSATSGLHPVVPPSAVPATPTLSKIAIDDATAREIEARLAKAKAAKELKPGVIRRPAKAAPPEVVRRTAKAAPPPIVRRPVAKAGKK